MCLTSLIRSRCMCGNRFWLSLFRAFIARCVCLFWNESRMWEGVFVSFLIVFVLFCECVGFGSISSSNHQIIRWFLSSLLSTLFH